MVQEKTIFGRYSVTSLGEVFSSHSKGKVPLKLKTTPNGYNIVGLYSGGETKWVTVHKLVIEAFIGPIPEGMVINHKDLNKKNNTLENLEICTLSYNLRHPHFGKKRFVDFNKKRGKYRVIILHEGVRKYFGAYDSQEEAYEVAKEKYKSLFNEYPWR